MSSGWEYILGRSSDREQLGVLKNSHERSLAVDLNKSGTASCWIPMKSNVASLVYPWRTCLIAQYDGDVFWSGPVKVRSRNWSTGRVTISAVGWFERLMKLNFLVPVTYTNLDAGRIVELLLELAHEQDPYLQVTRGTIRPTQPRTISYPADQSIGQAILDLASIEAGYDWYIDPVTIELNVVERIGSVNLDVQWSYLEGADGQMGGNLADLDDILDGDSVANDIIARGKYASARASDPIAQEYLQGVFQDAPSLSDVVNIEILEAYTNAEIVYRSLPQEKFTLKPKPTSAAGLTSVPKLFRDFQIGDTNLLVARKEDASVEQNIRIFGASLAISDLGVETLSNLQTEYS